jgi:hypothetical protein
VSKTPQSNQNAGADERSCPWCRLWNAAFAAGQLPVFAKTPPYYSHHYTAAYRLRAAGIDVMDGLARRKTDCPGCQRSAKIHLGDVLGDERRAWRAEMWQINPSMRFMMRQGPSDTFQEDAK